MHLADLTKWLREALLARRHGPVAVLVTSATKLQKELSQLCGGCELVSKWIFAILSYLLSIFWNKKDIQVIGC